MDEVNIKKFKENVYIQTILILANYLFLVDYVIPVTFGKNEFRWFNINILNDFISKYFPWFHACLFILFILSLFLGNIKKYKYVLFPVYLINLIAIIPGLVIAILYLLAGLFGGSLT